MRSLHPWPIFPVNLDPPIARSLSIQFILNEMIDSFERLKYLQKTTPEQLQGANLKEELAFIAKELEKILLFSMENSFVQKGSALDKLCFYCEILLQASLISASDIPTILEDMRNSVLRIRTKIIAWKKMPLFHPLDQILEHLLELYFDLKLKFCAFFKALIPFLMEARSDENVLIYLIEKKDSLNSHLGERTIEKLLQSFFPFGYSQLRAAIHEGYTRRGFTNFFSSREPLIEAIEWEAPCHPLPTR